PSAALWEQVAAELGGTTVTRRRDDPTRALPRHPLLASFGRDARELQLVLGPVESEHVAVPEPPATLLGRLQRDLRADLAPARAPLPARRTRGRCSPRPTTPCRCTPAMAGRARSRSCATPSSTCWRTIRRSSRATSSSCAPTSRPSRRWCTRRSARRSR